jgi:hypothetical protein
MESNIRIYTELDFDNISWHDSCLYGFTIESDKDKNNLILVIDFITEWVGCHGGQTSFKIAPATLTFHDVTDFCASIPCHKSEFQVFVRGFWIDAIERTRIERQLVCFDKLYYSWRIILSTPAEGSITFGATGFSLFLRQAPVLRDKQWLERNRHS